jgi:murein DD-endopeptidase MepM/ murein hydrolase activator NlpD
MRRNAGYAAPVLLGVLHLALYLALQARPGMTGVVLWYLGPAVLVVLAVIVLVSVLVSARRHRATLNRTRIAGLAFVAALSAAPAFYRTYPSSHDGRPSDVRFVLPLSGPVTIAWGGEPSSVNAHVVAPDQRWGYDLIVTVDGKSFRGSGRRVTDYFVYGRPVLAPASGVVHTVRDVEPDMPVGRKGRGDDLGNHIALQVAPSQLLYIAHLQPGSIAVKQGDRVTEGQHLARVGNSGISSEPHVHVHLQDSDRRHFAEGIPFYFSDYCNADGYVARGIPTGGRTGERWTGQVISQAINRACDVSTPHQQF